MSNSKQVDYETEANILAGLILAIDIVQGATGDAGNLALVCLIEIASDRAKAVAGLDMAA